MTEEILEKASRICQLLDIYGGLLTERQRRFVELHFAQDFSFGEIAKDFQITRQAVHDTVKNALALLNHYESCLHLLKMTGSQGAEGDQATTSESKSLPEPPEPDIPEGKLILDKTQLIRIMESLRDLRNRVEKQRVIYSSDWIVTRLAEIERLLEAENA